MIAVEDGRTFGAEKIVGGEHVEDARKKSRSPAVQQVAGDGEMIRPARGDAIELAIQPRRIVRVAQMQVRQVRDQHTSDLCVESRIVRRHHAFILLHGLFVTPRRVVGPNVRRPTVVVVARSRVGEQVPPSGRMDLCPRPGLSVIVDPRVISSLL